MNLYETTIWKVPVSSKYCEGVRYRLAFIRCGEDSPAVLYDNHTPRVIIGISASAKNLMNSRA